ncbi:hypothetical protein [Pseudomonas sp. B21-010]|uniref:hypothetical protein n=1 Tax=Pseudomonas sp. B21-010 TaxID=2895471 RepID=UPI00215E69CB|nr:hypothetical protein [Pseudomonas sp. B21-010]UVM63918.1 hypothetical protein LOY50_13040 [Pseudomonas sp. B21-010]
MKSLIVVPLLALLAGCATNGKSDQQIYMEAGNAHVMTLPAGQNEVSLPGTKILSHGLIADNLAIAAGGGANAVRLKQELLNAKSAGDSGFLIIGAASSLDVAIIKNAFDTLDLKGMRIYYAGAEAQRDEARAAIEKANAHFQYISAMK